jgi:DNA polymerase-3 subunit alpha
MQFTVQQIWSLEQARCRFGKYLKVAVNGKAPDIARMLREFPAQREMSEQGELVRGLGVRLALQRPPAQGAELGARAELHLGDNAKFFPTDAALAAWRAQAEQGQAIIAYD